MSAEVETGEEREFPRPRLLLSRCLELDACRYNAETIRSGVVRGLEPHVELVPTCPEVEIGLGVPRPPIRLVSAGGSGSGEAEGDGALRLVQPSTGRDLTEGMTAWANRFVDATGPVDGAILKSRSPSCGIRDAKVYSGPEEGTPLGTAPGAFARIILARYPQVAVEDEGRLADPEIRHHFLTRIYASARLREAVLVGPRGLARFHMRYKLVLMAHSPVGQRTLGRAVAGLEGSTFEADARSYAEGFAAALADPARIGANVNVIQHAQGYFKRLLTPAEKRRFQELQDRYREGRIPLQALLSVLGGWVVRFDEGYLREQAYFRPYPQELVVAGASGGNRLG